ncbi:hypothetical protein SLA2020_454360 [Shorea laevis]
MRAEFCQILCIVRNLGLALNSSLPSDWARSTTSTCSTTLRSPRSMISTVRRPSGDKVREPYSPMKPSEFRYNPHDAEDNFVGFFFDNSDYRASSRMGSMSRRLGAKGNVRRWQQTVTCRSAQGLRE